ncbi:tol-pal system-associated acyl-CoA thioesterase [Ramlibacter sp. AW1]|uniref:Tol-pal system-associated acyl-CoA thioesterase n=1 Tax=Ramlibacter aurantiacus TaxID=2801330 RepID=A0A936ZGG5_9BURK|nr:tol-pal system-associated acyl-CoA thioesterase [Ramlibacter aurantiacus]MBL0420477.1 tol-pal system-associated acyl-CoA thioesterase [Ramlibacter aurantiacus]
MSFSFPIRVYWEDTDAGGIVFYANYLKYFERARTEWLRALGFNQSRLRDETGGIFVVSETAVRYLRPARLDDELIITARIESAGKASLVVAQQALGRSSGQLMAEGSIRLGWVEAATLQPARIPSIVIESLLDKT